MIIPSDCGIIHDRNGFACARLGSNACSDCGTTLCDLHVFQCETCNQTFCDCCLYFHAKVPHARNPLSAKAGTLRRSA